MPRRPRRSAASQILADAAYIGNRASWKLALALGAAFFVALYWVVPALLESRLEATESQSLRPALEVIIGRRLHWFKWLAIAVGLVFAYYAARTYLRLARHKSRAQQSSGHLARLLARLLS